MAERQFNVLFLCTNNAARSLIAEAQLNFSGKERFKAYSAGSFPAGTINPHAIEFLQNAGLSTEGLRSKSWDEFAADGAPVMDYVLTVCDDVAENQCPVWPGQPITAHWSVRDPSAVEGDNTAKRQAMLGAAAHLRKRIELLVALPTSSLDRMAIARQLQDIGRS
jgi:arsenate reductase